MKDYIQDLNSSIDIPSEIVQQPSTVSGSTDLKAEVLNNLSPEQQVDFVKGIAGVDESADKTRKPTKYDGPCPKCGEGNDRFGVWFSEEHGSKAMYRCNVCGISGDLFSACFEFNAVAGDNFVDQAKYILNHHGLYVPEYGNAAGPKHPVYDDPIGKWCEMKGIEKKYLLELGAEMYPANRKPNMQVFRIPAVAEDGSRDGGQLAAPYATKAHASMIKGINMTGRSSGVFLPKDRLPAAGEHWIIVEGPKDLCKLRELGFENVAGIAGQGAFKPRHGEMFKGCDVTYVPDLDIVGQDIGVATLKSCIGFAKTMKIARLKGKLKDTKGRDVRDVCKKLDFADAQKMMREVVSDADDFNPEIHFMIRGNERTEVVVDGSNIGEAIRRVSSCLSRFNQVKNDTSQVFLTPYGVGCVTKSGKKYAIEPHDAYSIQEVITDCVSLLTETTDRNGNPVLKKRSVNKELAMQILKSKSCRDLYKPLEAIHVAPRITESGIVADELGYNSETEAYFASDIKWGKVPDQPTLEDAQASASVLLDLTHDFPFETDADRSAWLLMVLTMAGREFYTGCTPMFQVSAPDAGSGKSLLVNVASQIGFGRSAPPQTLSKNDEEVRKMVMSTLMQGSPVLNFDNVPSGSVFDHPIIDSLLTSEEWSDRILSTNTIREVRNRFVTVFSGNNVSLGGDASRRTIPMRIMKQVDSHTVKREYKHNLMAFTQEQYATYTIHALTILRAFHVAGRPSDGTRLDSFEGWSIIRDAVCWLGLTDPFDARSRIAENDETKQEATRVLLGLAALIGSNGSMSTTVQTSEIRQKLVSHLEALRETRTDTQTTAEFQFQTALLDTVMSKGNVSSKRINETLKTHASKQIEGFSLVKVSDRNACNTWGIVRGRSASDELVTCSEVIANFSGGEIQTTDNLDERAF